MVHCMYLQVLVNFYLSKTLSQGLAILAFLYKELCWLTQIEIDEIDGCCLLLLTWVYLWSLWLISIVGVRVTRILSLVGKINTVVK